MTANYSLRSGSATLTIIDYPTPQIAIAQESKIRAYVKAGSQTQPAWPKPLLDSDVASLEVRRSGPLGAPVLINAGRGGLQNEADILACLDDGTLAPVEKGRWQARDCSGSPHLIIWGKMVRRPGPWRTGCPWVQRSHSCERDLKQTGFS